MKELQITMQSALGVGKIYLAYARGEGESPSILWLLTAKMMFINCLTHHK